jgi:hypothetical protein
LGICLKCRGRGRDFKKAIDKCIISWRRRGLHLFPFGGQILNRFGVSILGSLTLLDRFYVSANGPNLLAEELKLNSAGRRLHPMKTATNGFDKLAPEDESDDQNAGWPGNGLNHTCCEGQ